MKPKDTYDGAYRGSEYMSIYPYVAYYDGTEKYTDGDLIPQGYYVRTQEKNTNYITPFG